MELVVNLMDQVATYCTEQYGLGAFYGWHGYGALIGRFVALWFVPDAADDDAYVVLYGRVSSRGGVIADTLIEVRCGDRVAALVNWESACAIAMREGVTDRSSAHPAGAGR